MPSNLSKAQTNQSSEKLIALIEYLANQDAPMRLLDISKALNSNTSTMLRFLNSLIKTGYVMQEPESSRYYLSYKICTIANKVCAKTDIRAIASPYMKELSSVFGESVCLSVEQDMKIVYIDIQLGQDQMIRSMQRIGNIAPMHCTAVGKVFLTAYNNHQIDRLVEVAGLQRYTEHTLTSKQQLLDAIKKVREDGYATDEEECEIGANCVACPIYDHTGKIVAGISITGPISRFTKEFILKRVGYLKKATLDISKQLGFEC